MTDELTINDIVAATRHQVSAELSDEAVILGMRDGVYYGVEAVGARIWSLVQQPVCLSAVVETLVAEFDVESPECSADVLAFVRSLLAKGLVERVAAEPAA